MSELTALINNVAAIAMACVFIWYLIRRDKQIEGGFSTVVQMHVEAVGKLESLKSSIDRLEKAIDNDCRMRKNGHG